MHDFTWFRDRLDVAHENAPGDFHAGCPVCGGSDPLHVSEKNGKALVKCFSCGAGYVDVVSRLEDSKIDDGAAKIDDDEAPSEPVRGVRIGVRKGASSRARAEAKANLPARGVRLPAASIKPLDWMAARCGLTRADLKGLPLSENGVDLIFEFPGTGAEKRRGVGEGKAEKKYSWRGPVNPPFWPLPEAPGEEIVVCEGEADAICLRASGIEAYSITKGSQGLPPEVVWDSLRAEGVETVRLVFDMDEAGRKGRAGAAEGARSAGLHVLESRVVGIRPLAGEKDARDVALRQGYPLAVEDDADEDLPILLSDVDAVEPEDPLLGRLHPTEHTILYGDGGTGKGVIGAWWVAQMTRGGSTVLIVDYEWHMNYEWRPRVEGFGGIMENVAVVQPVRPIWDISGWLRTQAATYDYIVIDSVSYACVGEEVEKSVTATRYSAAVNQLGKPALSIAHVTKADQDPNHPFGSIFWSNGARVTVAVSRQNQADPASPRMLRNPKTNQRGPFSPVTLDWSWLGNDGPPGCDCAKPPPDQRGMPHHLHETALTPNKRQVIADTRAILTTELKREPTYSEVEARITAEWPDLRLAPGYVSKELTGLRQSQPIIKVRRATQAG